MVGAGPARRTRGGVATPSPRPGPLRFEDLGRRRRRRLGRRSSSLSPAAAVSSDDGREAALGAVNTWRCRSEGAPAVMVVRQRGG